MDHFTRQGLRFDLTAQGPVGGPAVVALHGFPQTRRSWDLVAPMLVARGLRVLAPDQRGYSPGARPVSRRAYRIGELAADVLAMADQAGIERFHVVGHDWGGVVAWELGARHPERLRSLTVLSMPHPASLLRAFASSTQGLRSWYMAALQVPRLPERALGAGSGRFARAVLLRSGLPEDRMETTAALLADRPALAGALAWYRALPLSVAAMRHVPPVTVPTVYAWGTEDRFLGRAAAEGTARYVTGPYRLEILVGTSHWILDTVPEVVDRIVADQVMATEP